MLLNIRDNEMRAEGRAEGRVEGLAEGRVEGRAEEQSRITDLLIGYVKNNILSITDAARLTNVTPEEFEKIAGLKTL